MDKTIFIDGQAAVTLNKDNKLRFLQFQADDELSPILVEGCQNCGQLQILHNGNFDFVPNRPKSRANSKLIRKAAHGRLSGTKDSAFQLTLKCYLSEKIDWQLAFVVEAVDLLKDVMGSQRMTEILNKLIVELSKPQDNGNEF